MVLAILILVFHLVFEITENIFIHQFPKIWSSDSRKWYHPAQNHTLRILKLQILKVKKSGLLPEKSQISRSAHRATNTNPQIFLKNFLSFQLLKHCYLQLLNRKGQIISKANCQAMNSSKKRTNEFVFTYYARSFRSFFGRNWRHKKDISKLTYL